MPGSHFCSVLPWVTVCYSQKLTTSPGSCKIIVPQYCCFSQTFIHVSKLAFKSKYPGNTDVIHFHMAAFIKSSEPKVMCPNPSFCLKTSFIQESEVLPCDQWHKETNTWKITANSSKAALGLKLVHKICLEYWTLCLPREIERPTFSKTYTMVILSWLSLQLILPGAIHSYNIQKANMCLVYPGPALLSCLQVQQERGNRDMLRPLHWGSGGEETAPVSQTADTGL